MAWCDDELGHLWPARPDGWIRQGDPCDCLRCVPCPADVEALDGRWVSETEAGYRGEWLCD